MEKIIYKVYTKEQMHIIKPLWQELNKHHADKTNYFIDYYENFTFEKRMSGLLEGALNLRVEVAVDTIEEQNIGYCLSSINDKNQGEVESLYIKKKYRGQKIGDAFMKHALKWMDVHQVTSKKITVAQGNEEVFEFYAKYNFYPRLTTLVLREESNNC